MARWCVVNFQGRGVLLIWIRVGQGPSALAVGAGGGCLDILSLIYHFSFLSPSLRETARYRLKYCLKEPLSPKQPTNQRYRYIDIIIANNLSFLKINKKNNIMGCYNNSDDDIIRKIKCTHVYKDGLKLEN